jgi:hypothetical protein
MNWFERHLNWSLFLADFLLPVGINVTFLLIYLNLLGRIFSIAGSSEELFIQNMFTSFMPVAIISIAVELVACVVIIVVTLWYLGKKERSKGFVILLVGPWVFAFILAFFNTGRIGGILGGLGYLVGVIILLLLENRAIGYGRDFVDETVADQWRPDTGQFGTTDDWQPKELDYSPAKNVQDIAYGGAVKDVGDVGVSPSGEVPPAFPSKATEETPAEVSAEISPEVPVEAAAETRAEVPPEVPTEIPDEAPAEVTLETTAEAPAEAKVTEEAVRLETLTMPILLDDAGGVIKCFYHPDADAVNLCSRCRQYVCSQCNYVTGTHPICRNCWEKRAEMPVLPVSPEVQKSPKLSKSEKPTEMPILPVSPEVQEGPKLSQSEKRKAEEDERLRGFMQLYEQALPVISTVIKKRAEGLLASPFDLMEGLKLRPMLKQAKKLSKPKEKSLHEAKKEFEQLLLACIKVAEAAERFVSLGGQAVPSEADLARLDAGIEKANGLMEGLSQRLASLSQSQK